MKVKVIILIHFPPHLDFTSAVKFRLPNGEETCFNNDRQYWFYTLGNQMMNQFSDKLEIEIWQPEPKTKRILKKRFDNGLVYKLFPAEYVNEITITGRKKRLFSKRIIQKLKSESVNRNLILHFRATNEYLTKKIVNIFFNKIILLGQLSINVTYKFNIQNNFFVKSLYLYYRNLQPYKKFLRKIYNIIPGTKTDIKKEAFFNNLNVFYRDECANFGLDTDFWDKNKLDILQFKKNKKNNKFLLVSSPLNEGKRIDNIITALSRIKTKNPYKLVITGSYNNSYGQNIKSLTDKLIPNKAIFTGFISEEELRKYYAISDLFISNSQQEAGPFSVYQAYLMQVPVIQTKVGIGGEVGESFNVSKLITSDQDKNEDELEQALTDYFNGNIPKIMDRTDSERYFGWNSVANYYFKIYISLISAD
ncbi:MAG: glycosyltransferase [Bacteroidales bacterium]|nr:glycosyltransferase [Bacteroidales bacterium]